ncbi:MAG: type I secretion system permease/ATPase [Pseudomonadota bacterium]
MIAAPPGRGELRAALKQDRGLFWGIGLFSAFVNLLMLTGPIYMLQVYDRVLSSRSIETLVALSLLVVFLYSMMGLLDFARGRVMARVGARFQARLERRVFDASMRRAALQGGTPVSGMRDLEQVQRLMTAPVSTAVFDIPWTPIFLFGIFIFHPWLGTLALSGGALLIVIAILNQRVSREAASEASSASFRADTMAARVGTDADMISALGMRETIFDRWKALRGQALDKHLGAADTSGSFLSATKALRLMLQSAMLGLGALLVLRNELTPGAMIAGSILLGRALAPIEQATGSWPVVQAAQKSWAALVDLLASSPAEAARTKLPRPAAKLDVQNVSVIPKGAEAPLLRGVSFSIGPGQAVGVIGPSGAGKSTLARVITGALTPAAGEVRLDGALLEQYSGQDRGDYIGYLPQRVRLFDGTIAENIARLAHNPEDDQVVKAAVLADAHAMIVDLPSGYDTEISGSGDQLSGGQIQRVGLARALYGAPVLLVLDEPNSNLDNAGSEAVNAAIRGIKAGGNAVVVIAHRPAAIKECDLVLMLEGGRVRAFGPKNQVLRDVLQNSAEVMGSDGQGGVQ